MGLHDISANLVTTTDGNHRGMAARMAARFGAGATVFVPVGMLSEKDPR